MLQQSRSLRVPACGILFAIWLLVGVSACVDGAYAAEPVPTVQFSVSKYRVTGPNPLDESTTDIVLDPFVGTFDGLDGLLSAVEALQRALNQRGYTFFRVVLPPQTLESGVVQLDVVPIRFGEVVVEGNVHFNEHNIRASLPSLRGDQIPDTKAIAQNLELLNRHPRKRTNVRLRQSDEKNTIDAIVTVEDERPYQVFVGLNNVGTRQTGRTRLSIGGQYSNLFNLDHKLTLSYTTSPEKVSDVTQVSANYELPLYAASGYLNAFYSFSDVDVGQVGDFEVSGAGRFWGLSFARVLRKRGSYRHQWSLGLQNRYFENNVDFLGLQPIGVDVRSVPITLAYQGSYASESWSGAFYGAYSRNLAVGDRNDGLSYALSRAGAESDWDLLRFNGNAAYRLPREWLLRALMDAQWAGEALISGEEFGLTGWRAVRGLDERAITGDNGVRTSFEVWSPGVTRLAGVRFLAFVDVGFRDREKPQPGEVNSDTVSSAGLGARWNWQDDLSVTLDYGHTLAEGEGPTAAAKDENGVKWHFNVYYRF